MTCTHNYHCLTNQIGKFRPKNSSHKPDVTRTGIKDKTRKVLKILKENDLYLKPEKCVFEATRIEYLGYVIEEGKIMMDP